MLDYLTGEPIPDAFDENGTPMYLDDVEAAPEEPAPTPQAEAKPRPWEQRAHAPAAPAPRASAPRVSAPEAPEAPPGVVSGPLGFGLPFMTAGGPLAPPSAPFGAAPEGDGITAYRPQKLQRSTRSQLHSFGVTPQTVAGIHRSNSGRGF